MKRMLWKRKLYWLIGILLALSVITANAQTLITEDLDENYRKHISQYDSTIEVESLWYDWHVPMLERLQSGDVPDLLLIRSHNDDLPALIEAGMLADVSGSSVIQADIAGMYPSVQALVAQADGKIYGVPVLFYLNNDTYVPAAWERAGLDYACRPASFTGLLDLAEQWLATGGARSGVCFLRMKGDDLDHPHCRWFLNTLVCTILTQSCQSGTKPVFNSPDVITLVSRSVETGKALETSEARERAAKDTGCLIYGSRTNGYALSTDQPVTADDLIPFALTANDPPLYWGNLEMVCMTAGSAWGEDGIKLLELYPECRKADYQLLRLFPDHDFSAYNSIEIPMNHYNAAYLESLKSFSGTIVLPVNRITYMDTYMSMCSQLIGEEISAEAFYNWLDTETNK